MLTIQMNHIEKQNDSVRILIFNCLRLSYSLIGIVVGLMSAEGAGGDIKIIDDQALAEPQNRPGDWLSYGLTQAENRFSPLKQIHKENIHQLGLAWSKKLGTTRGVEATPIVVNEVMSLVSGLKPR